MHNFIVVWVDFRISSYLSALFQRVLPVEDTADVDLKKLNDMVLKCVSRHLKAGDDGSFPSYAMEFKARNNDSIKKTDVLEMLGDAVNAVAPTSKVDLNNADITFMVQLVRKTMMVGGMPNYYAKRKYSMRPKEEKRDDVKAGNGENTSSVNEAVENKEEAGADGH
ncbi:THUMP domain protein [Oesophagostomum dentatum]|uniref:THUMP domain protein n=1 Tax=Oesophagostomum dentatum TaxID=61180 RepID=A0A0B1SR66_OESDE|nr:THUMP domain protein [Oesophagostomum dentatum]